MIIYGVDMKNSKYASNKKIHIYALGKNCIFIQCLQYGSTIYPGSDYNKVNASQMNKISLHYHVDNSYLFINGVKQLQFKAMDKLNLKRLLLIGNVTANFETTTQYDKTYLKGDIYDFALDYKKADLPKIYDIHRYLMKKTSYFINIKL